MYVRTGLQREVFIQAFGRVYVGVAVHAAETQKFRVGEAGNQAEHPVLRAVGHFRLAAHQIEGAAFRVFGPELEQGVGAAARARIGEAHGLERAEGEGAVASVGERLDGHAALEVYFLFEVVGGNAFGLAQGFIEGRVFGLRHGAVQIVAVVLRIGIDHGFHGLFKEGRVVGIGRGRVVAVAGAAEGYAHVHGVGPDDGRNGIVEIQARASAVFGNDAGQRRGEVFRNQRSGGYDDGFSLELGRVEGGNLTPYERDERFLLHAAGKLFGKQRAVHGKGLARRNGAGGGYVHGDAVKFPHFLFEQAHARTLRVVGPEGVRAYELAEQRAGVGGGKGFRFLFVKGAGEARACKGEGAFTACESAADDDECGR